MLRILFQPGDLRRTRVAEAPDPMWELVLSLSKLQARNAPPQYRHWRSHVRRIMSTVDDRSWLRLLSEVISGYGNFPDFLTPTLADPDPGAALEHMAAISRQDLRDDITSTLRRAARPPAWAKALAAGDRQQLAELIAALRTYYDVLLAPYLDVVLRRVAIDRAARANDLVTGGVDRMLGRLHRSVTWQGDVLLSEYPCFCPPGDDEADRHTLDLAGRGITLVPSHFCWGMPVKLINPARDPVLVYPADADITESHGIPAPDRDPLGKLIGRTRASLLRSLSLASSTTELARRFNVSPAAVSQHMAVLRNAGLVTTTRTGMSVRHTITRRGLSLLNS